MTELQIWTDGGIRKKLGIASWAFCLYSPDLDKVVCRKSGLIKNKPTSQIAELTAGIKGLNYVLTYLDVDNIRVTVYSDSQYLVKGSNEWLWGWKNRSWKGSSGTTIKNLKYWQKIDELKSKFKKLRFEWVRGHSGVELNELVDGMCQEVLEEAHQHEKAK